MYAYIVSDGEFDTPLYHSLDATLGWYLREKGLDVMKTSLRRDSLAACSGCFGCWVRTPGECVAKDGIGEINRQSMNSLATIYLCPVVFGQFSANMKNAIDRWLPNMLPFFMTRPDGSTMHPPRYLDYPRQIMIGYADDLSDSDAALFRDITQKHRSNIDVFFYRSSEAALRGELDGVRFERVGGYL